MKKRLDAKELVKEFNQLRTAQTGKTFTGAELDKLLNKYGFAWDLCLALKRANVFDSIKSGVTKLFSFKKDPLFVDRMEQIIKDMQLRRKGDHKKVPTLSKEEEALQFLKKSGYQIKKLVGFDESRFAKENPELYQKYLVYEYV